MKTFLALLLVIGLLAAGAVYYTTHAAADPPASFRTATVERGELLWTISATGTVEPEEVVDVGAQVVGRIKNLGVDPTDPTKTIDYGSVVQEGTVLAQIDDAVYKAQVDQARASLLRAQADLLQMKAKLDQSKREWERAESLRPTKAIADTDYDLAVANYEVAKANVGVGEATVKASEAALQLAETNLNYTIIKSPVQGVIVDRRVNVGQTVVASLNAPSLFLIAKDLRRMQVWASVNEADIGRIHKNMPVRFTVDAYPGEVFRGTVGQIRLNASMVQNVVTYTVVVVTDNSNLKLLPYLTANVQFEVERREDVLLVPNAALRWKPQPEQVAPEVSQAASTVPVHGDGKGSRAKGGHEKGEPSGKPESDGAAKDREDRGRLWVKDGGWVRPVDVQLGASDGSSTEVSGPGVREGMEVVVGEVHSAADDETTNPFIPRIIRGNQKGLH